MTDTQKDDLLREAEELLARLERINGWDSARIIRALLERVAQSEERLEQMGTTLIIDGWTTEAITKLRVAEAESYNARRAAEKERDNIKDRALALQAEKDVVAAERDALREQLGQVEALCERQLKVEAGQPDPHFEQGYLEACKQVAAILEGEKT